MGVCAKVGEQAPACALLISLYFFCVPPSFFSLSRTDDTIHLLHVIPIPTPEIIGGVGMGGPGDFVMSEPDPAKDKAALAAAEAFMAKRFVPVLEGAKKEYAAEVVHFATDADSVAAIVEARAVKLGASAVVLAKHSKGAIKQLFLG